MVSAIAWLLLVAACTYIMLGGTMAVAAFMLIVREWLRQKGVKTL